MHNVNATYGGVVVEGATMRTLLGVIAMKCGVVAGDTTMSAHYLAAGPASATYCDMMAGRLIAGRSICLDADIDPVLDALVAGPGLGEDGLS